MTTDYRTTPTLSAWAGLHRKALRLAASMTKSERARSDQLATTAVLLYALASTPPASFRVGDIERATGLSPQLVADAIADLEGEGRIEPGSSRTGRIGVLAPAVLDALGLTGQGLTLDVRADVVPSGSAAELSDDDLAASFAGIVTT
ncbi:hypothetical protein [Pengzhenrongella sicca]|uniref:Uncharacterized protein n=1 Tax=Pengzhenrongella sicca TaxID=2819238 RepID=A0A8A4ZHJ0_9MICO|nr:hypothetical protein [Pengzhenrongella sicca]QTE30433.1 hypothetical protein J4E96_05435 [Pengzhenrongella sicca]